MKVVHEYTEDGRYHRVARDGRAGPWASTHQLANGPGTPASEPVLFASTRHHPALPDVFTVHAHFGAELVNHPKK